MASLKCPIPECTFEIGNDVQSDCKGAMLQLHLVHHQTLLTDLTAAKPEKLKRPTITTDNSTDDWHYFLSRWNTYKSATKLSGKDISGQLLECCEESLRKNLTRVHKTALHSMDESQLLQSIKALSVIEETTLVSRFKLHNLKQDIDETIKNFVARIKGHAYVCKLFETCPNCNFAEVDFSNQIIRDVITRGIADDGIRLSLLGDENQNMSLEQTVSFIEAKESGNKSAGHLLVGTSSTAAVSRYKKREKQSIVAKCGYCGEKANHGSSFKERQTRCPAFKHVCKKCRITGHLEIVCRRKDCVKITREKQDVADEENSTSENAIFDELCESECDFVFASNDVGKMKSCNFNESYFSLNHHVYNTVDCRWELKPSEPQPTMLVSACISKSSYNYFNIKPPNGKINNLKVIADTGCQSCLAGLNILPKLGLSRRHLLKCSMKMNSANNKCIPIEGALFLEISGSGPSGKKLKTQQIVYFTSQCDKFYLNRNSCFQLGLI